MYQEALQKYSRANNGQALTDLTQMQTYFDSPVDDAILQRWQIEPSKKYGFPDGAGFGDWVITDRTAVDEIFDTHFTFGAKGVGTVPYLNVAIGGTMSPVYRAFQAANNGRDATDYSQLLPYATTPEQQAALQKMMLQASAMK